ncbi:ribonuclease E/G [Oceanicaulis sp. MMSF_3324]|uniref:ribonuclease E/G n=1 Tax=Oceanicaulis sp. MMSF_3324 TaxID=3046702 RepID=UPI00273FA834|nr:ribonuclease E/G [Oceanicaulis sp. MMSF_3324]
MSRKMLIDAAHPEETRVVIVDNNRVEEFDFESASKKPIRGNIYLAKVTRVEPSLQAAFVEYGGNKHGFLAFNEIHPDYYQIPHEDRAALREAEAEATADLNDEAAPEDENEDAPAPDEDDLIDEAARRRRSFLRKYKIQEVIKRRQVLLVQVAKEERGNKGAALTTYLSLAGRYCVLMPNTARGGGISRKITNASDRKRLKSAVSELSVPQGMGLIIRTAGAARTKVEIKRDYDYLIRLWETIRTTTLESSAPKLIYEEGNLVKRVIRDLYDKEIDEVLVDGEDAYKEAKAFMRMLMPSHAKKVQNYRDATPLFLRHQVESQLEAIHSPIAQLKSGGYIVINPTEALVSIDVNSGKATKERNIEQTALKTNMEAAEEAARQMRLRDLAGLLVIDFIDMDENKNVRAVEKKMKDSLKRDRARLQVGRISQFGLMEMSRQRRRTSLVEGSTDTCPHCRGSGYIRSIESSALVALRALEEEGVRGRTAKARLRCSPEVALYILNEKRDHLTAIEARYEISVTVTADDSLIRPDCQLERLESRREAARAVAEAARAETPLTSADAVEVDAIAEADTQEDSDEASERESRPSRTASEETNEDGSKKRRRRGRRGGRNRRKRNEEAGSQDDAQAVLDNTQDESRDETASTEDKDEVAGLQVIEPSESDPIGASETEEDAAPRRKRPSRRRRKATDRIETANEDAASTDEAPSAEADAAPATEASSSAVEEAPAKPKRRTRRKKVTEEAEAQTEAQGDDTAAEASTEDEPPAKPKRRTRRKKAEPAADTGAETEPSKADSENAETEKPKRRTRRKKAEPDNTDAVAREAMEQSGTPADSGGNDAQPAPVAAPTPSDKPQSEASDASDEAAAESDSGNDGNEEARPAKRGWWQKSSKFLGLG